MRKRIPFVLIILDGWGHRKDRTHNAIAAARKPQWDQWWREKPHLLIDASGASVGLPPKQMGNSEVGHMHIGAGRLIPQDLTEINIAIKNGAFQENPHFHQLMQDTVKNNAKLHVLGLLSQGGVHSHENHLFAFLNLKQRYPKLAVCLHLFLDGRDTPPKSAQSSLKKLNTLLKKLPNISISSISGRFYAMDRDANWARIQPVYEVIIEGKSTHHFDDAESALDYFYQQGLTDEMIPPVQIGPKKCFETGDGLFFFNFRADRARQLSTALIDPSFNGFSRTQIPDIRQFLSMTPYQDNPNLRVAFKSAPIKNSLGDVISQAGLRQLRIAETEKYAHVSFFFNGGIENPFPLEDRILIPSPKVTSYDLQPEMNAQKITAALIAAIHSGAYDFIICNYANADMVGHSGNFAATVQAIECLDRELHQLGNVLEKISGKMIITADHGNAESMFDERTQQAHTAHTNHLVPLLFVGSGWQKTKTRGQLIDIAPTILSILGIPIPSEMTGHILLAKNHET